MNGNNIVVSGDSADGARVQKELESCELVLRAAADMDNPGILKVLRSSGAVLAPVQSNGEPAPGAELAHGQSGGQAKPGQAGSLEQGSGAGGDSPGRGGLRQVGSQDRLSTGLSLSQGNFPVQAAGVPVESGQGRDLAAGVELPAPRRGSPVKKIVTPYQAGDSGMG